MNNKSLVSIIIAGLVGAILGVAAVTLFGDSSDSTEQKSSKKEPLYWVAPMDANYRRDKPGKSPMGMDLVPVYEKDSGSDSPGTVSISPAVENNLAVRIAEVRKGYIEHEIDTVGYVQFDEDKLTHIHPRVEGWIEKLYVKAAGNPVKKGQPLYELYSPQLVNAQEEYLLALKRNHRDLINAAESRLRALKLSDAVIKELRTTRSVQQNVVFYSPTDGFIDELNIREGFFVKPGTTMMSVGALDQVWVEAEVYERQIDRVEAGLPVSMSLGNGSADIWEGNIDYVYPTLNAENRTGRVRIRFDNPDYQLKPNMFSNITIHASSSQQSIIIPREAVIRTEKQDRVVMALGEGKFKSIAVKLGAFGNDSVEVIEGLKAGERIVTSAQFLIDSESSKNSDFKRISQDSSVDTDTSSEADTESVWVEATINSVMAHHNMLNVSHGPIEQWGWPSMTMDLDTAKDVDLSAVKEGMTVHIQITQYPDNRYVITEIHIPAQTEEDQPEVDHSNMNHSNMNHSNMNHSNMDHSEMDHSEMNHEESEQ
ncbi:efflux RND transporter periplasmic adaptor subunit [Kangiella koreensis]|uniref:Efflux transporter, RND family, MFP subunit n=1 Tax=Kangiella koreensis (strain DSM 16069 / JCM 12317 / KCTC 12182 / SW-125) TaxID=523791 RepID=C7RCM8_KANKD|nr:efflux RND transporter periplasmic adaptor subunit [Kangiella koreensis]ACV27020.1 efflux transporter, RND family, MFP subunit [Kangiella koreensis DSM 16069]